MKVLIITYYWPPSGGSGVQRWLKFVKYLTQFDIEPVVYTVDEPNYAIEDKTLENEVPKSVKVIKQPIKEPNDILKLFGTKNKKTSAGFLSENPSFFGKIMQYIRANYFIPDARKFWVKPSVTYLTEYLINNPVDVIITTGPPHSLHLIGLQLKNKLGLKWIADFRDPWTDIDYFQKLPLTIKSKKKHHQLENEVVSKADCVLVVGNTMKENFLKFNKNVQVITNGYDGDRNSSKNELDKKFTLVHVGLVNADRNPKVLFEVLSELIAENTSFAKDCKLVFVGKLANEVIENLDQNNLKSHTEIIDYLPHKEVIGFQRKAQILLLLVNDVPSSKGIITGKIFEYLQSERPILAIGPEDGDLADILSETSSGEVIDFNDACKMKRSIEKLYSDYQQNELISGTKNIDKYHRKALTEQLSIIIKQLAS
ncbi:glycosyltransferase family 4 protein [Aureibaculum sp. A20]|uniref:Glycosyltransferase family 4 protein n=1 Tax=Aureibaculum flavum TaxID=2795986 RepID=A0ABS0WTR3_9FLAO|nr:glycosyltransferase family 4 protein [Aureibaculum flavum]MBJ2175357.1 glycosyltransferase family 4 protein [Aureibaculum flavum]